MYFNIFMFIGGERILPRLAELIMRYSILLWTKPDISQGGAVSKSVFQCLTSNVKIVDLLWDKLSLRLQGVDPAGSEVPKCSGGKGILQGLLGNPFLSTCFRESLQQNSVYQLNYQLKKSVNNSHTKGKKKSTEGLWIRNQDLIVWGKPLGRFFFPL